MMASHDFASTYVGTPFYMSPEICAAERYTLKSDIWSLGCIIYELCAREPPFNAKSHFQLVQKIKEGKVAPLPSVYSSELNNVIRDCLRVNPERRPDTAHLINIPMVKLMRKEKEVVDSARDLRRKHALADRTQQELDQRKQMADCERSNMRQEIDANVRREWEVKAKLEISRLVQLEIEQLRNKFDEEVSVKVRAEMQRRSTTPDLKAARPPPIAPLPEIASTSSDSEPSIENPSSSIGSNGESEFGSSTDLTDISIDSPETIQPKKRSTRTPLARAQTIGGFIGTPMDIEMGEPSPIAIASLSLSPRRSEATKAPSASRNIFAAAAGQEHRMQPILMNSDSEDDDDVPILPSPTRLKSAKNPFKAFNRPALISQKTAPVNKQNHSNIFNAGKGHTGGLPTLASAPDLRPSASNSSLKDRSPSPNRRISKIPSSTNLLSHDNPPTSPTRKSSLSKKTGSGGEDLNKLAVKNNMIKAGSGGPHAPKGRTLVELAQARAGGRPIGDGNRSPEPKGRAFAQRMADKVASRDQEPAVWDPEREEMPSPFLSRTKILKKF
jgi:serine/threonine protein kinase